MVKYYIVTAKCGHVGRGKYLLVNFPVKALSKEEAEKRVMQFPRVKSDLVDAVRGKEVTPEEFEAQYIINDSNPYLKSNSNEGLDRSKVKKMNPGMRPNLHIKKSNKSFKVSRKHRVGRGKNLEEIETRELDDEISNAMLDLR